MTEVTKPKRIRKHSESRELKNIELRNKQAEEITAAGNSNVLFAGVNKFNKSVWAFTHTECGTTQEWMWGHWNKSYQENKVAPCKHCSKVRSGGMSKIKKEEV